MVWAGRLSAVLVIAAGGLWIRLASALQDGPASVCACFRRYRRGTGLLPTDSEFRGASVRHRGGRASARREWTESSAPVSGDGDTSAHALPGLRWIHRPLRLCFGRADHE